MGAACKYNDVRTTPICVNRPESRSESHPCVALYPLSGDIGLTLYLRRQRYGKKSILTSKNI